MLKIWESLVVFLLKYPTPINLGFSWNFGVSSFIFLIIQIVTGFFLSMHYIANPDLAFDVVENIMRNVNGGWIMRYLHSNGASFFFLCVYLHIIRGIYFKSFVYPRAGVWYTGIIILLLMITAAFTGYILPWGQMSYWAATVITSLTSAIPYIGKDALILLWGGYSVGAPTLNRFFSIHYILPIVILVVVIIHILLLHDRGSSNRLSIAYKLDKTMFHNKFTVKDIYFIALIMFIYIVIVGFYPNMLGHPDNYIPADPLVTPLHIVPEWYFLPFYAILRSVPSKLGGLVIIVLAILSLFLLPNIVGHNIHYKRPGVLLQKKNSIFSGFDILKNFIRTWWILFEDFFYSILCLLFIINCFILGWLGKAPSEYPYIFLIKLSTVFYFIYFIVLFNYFRPSFSSVLFNYFFYTYNVLSLNINFYKYYLDLNIIKMELLHLHQEIIILYWKYEVKKKWVIFKENVILLPVIDVFYEIYQVVAPYIRTTYRFISKYIKIF